MHLRRAMLLMALILGAVAVVEAVAPVPRQRTPTERPPVAAPPAGVAPVRTLELRYPSAKRVPRIRVAKGAHVVLEVASSQPGEASVAKLGLVQPAEPATPARFDLLAVSPGTYQVAFAPSAGGSARVGSLVVAGPG
jgi:hypothetical protein